MKAKTLQIIWHSKDPVFSIDFHPDGYIATGGGDKDIKLWEMCCDGEGNPHVRYVSSLSGHSRTINCVRFSHSGHCLASAGDSGELIIWRPVPGSTPQPTATTATAAPPAAAPPLGTPLPAPAPKDRCSTPGSRSGSPPAAAAGAEEGQSGGGAWATAAAWKQSAVLRGHHDDVTDVAWSHDDAVVMSGSVENEVYMFDVEARRSLARLEGHRHYVQGVAWDPLGAWMVSQSADRTVRVHGLKPPPSGSKAAAAREGMRPSTALARDVLHTHTLSKVALQPPATPPQAAGEPAGEQAGPGADPQQQQQGAGKALQAALFHDESLNTFFRRLAWSPEGSLLAVPAGVYREHAGQQPQHATYIYARGHWGCPLLSLPCPSKASTVARFCPQVFKLKQQQQQGGGSSGEAGSSGDAGGDQPAVTAAAAAEQNALGLPYRLLLAVATMDSVLLYDMQTCTPLLLVGPLHYAPITDLAWSRDGSCLAVSSHDGYCSMVTFMPGELGEPLDPQDPAIPQGLQAALAKVAAAAAATAAKGSGVAAAPVSPVVTRPAGAGGATPGSTAAAAGTPQAAGQQQQQPVRAGGTSDLGVIGGGARSAPATDMGVIGCAARKPPVTPQAGNVAAAGAGAGSASKAPVRVAPRRVVPQAVPAAQLAAAPGFGSSPAPAAPVAGTPAAAAAAGAAAASGTPAASGIAAAQQQQGRPESGKAAAVGPAAASGGGRVGLAAVQAALAAAAKKKAAAKRAAEEAAASGGGGGGGGGDDDDVVIVGELAGNAGSSKRPKVA